MIENYGGLSYKGSENNGNTIYVEIKPDSGVWRPYNAPKRYRKVIDTVYLNQSP